MYLTIQLTPTANDFKTHFNAVGLSKITLIQGKVQGPG